MLRDMLASYKVMSYRSGPEDLVFPTATGGSRDPHNLRSRILIPTFDRADELLEKRGQVPLPKGLTTHKLRHTFASVLVASGEDPITVMTQLGHTDPGFTLRVYSHAMTRDPAERARLKALVKGERVIAVEQAATSLELVKLTEYELPILRAIAERGGEAYRCDVLDAVEEDLANRHSELDRTLLPSGSTRWEARASKARQVLVKKGLVERSSPRGLWELTPAGFERARRGRRGEYRPARAEGRTSIS